MQVKSYCPSRVAVLPFAVSILLLGAVANAEAPMPKMIAYWATPNPYFNDHANEIARLYDGFFFTVGSWDEGAAQSLGVETNAPAPPWKTLASENIAHLRAAGATENLLGVCFGESAPWPSPETLLAPEYTQKMARQFSGIAREAKALGCRGISVDVEYPYPRYSLDHPIYTYANYTAQDLLDAAATQGRAITNAMLDEFPDAVIALLPGGLWSRPLARAFQLAMLETMAERNAPGGLHLFSERAYCLLDPVSQVAIPREGDLAVRALVDNAAVLEYWRRCCTVAPGVWPLHMIETGGKDYPVRPWPEEMTELRQQMQILRATAKRYVWSFSCQPLWHDYAPDLVEKCGLGINAFADASQVAAQWHDILRDRTEVRDPHLLRLIRAVRKFDRGKLSPEQLCDGFGTPARWLVLGPLDNPKERPAYSAPEALLRPIRLDQSIAGRDGAVRWFELRNYEPTGAIRVMGAFDWLKTDMASVQLVAEVACEKETKALVHLNWDDGAALWLNGALILDRREYPERGHGLLFRDRYDFEATAPMKLPAGRSRIAVVCINQRGGWGVNFRLTDPDGWPIGGVRFLNAQ